MLDHYIQLTDICQILMEWKKPKGCATWMANCYLIKIKLASVVKGKTNSCWQGFGQYGLLDLGLCVLRSNKWYVPSYPVNNCIVLAIVLAIKRYITIQLSVTVRIHHNMMNYLIQCNVLSFYFFCRLSMLCITSLLMSELISSVIDI